MKYFRIIILCIPYLISGLIISLSYELLNIIYYLAAMIVPIFMGAAISIIIYKKGQSGLSNIAFSGVGTVIYAVFFTTIIMIMKRLDIMNFIYKNSRELFREGFSIGYDFSINLIDMVLPLCFCFLVHFIALQLSDKFSRPKPGRI